MRRKQLKSNDRRVSGARSENTNNGNGRKNDNKKVNFRWIEGKKVFNKLYPRDEFRRLSKAQREAVVDMYKESKSKGKGGRKTHNTSSLSKDDIVSLGEAIVAGVTKAQKAELSDTEETEDTSSISTKSTRKAPSGGVGNFLAKRKKPKKT